MSVQDKRSYLPRRTDQPHHPFHVVSLHTLVIKTLPPEDRTLPTSRLTDTRWSDLFFRTESSRTYVSSQSGVGVQVPSGVFVKFDLTPTVYHHSVRLYVLPVALGRSSYTEHTPDNSGAQSVGTRTLSPTECS